MKRNHHIAAALMTLVLLVSMVFSTAAAATQTYQGLEANLTVGKKEYDAGESVTAYVTLLNNGFSDAAEVEILVSGPSGYVAASENGGVQRMDTLAAGGKAEMSVTFQPVVAPTTGDDSNLLLLAALLLLSGSLSVYLLCDRQRARRTFLWLLVLSFAFSGVSISASPAKAESGLSDFSFSVQEDITVGGKAETVTVTVSYKKDSSNGITREKWISSLMNVLEIETLANAVVTFDDFEKAQNAKLVQTAINFGFMPTETDRDYVQLAHPDELADREFLAYTTYLALQMSYEGEEAFKCADILSIEHPEAARMAVDLEMLALENGRFNPRRAVTADEVNASLAAVRKLLNSTNVNVDDEDYVALADGVTEISVFFTADTENRIITVYEPEKVQGLEKDKVYILRSTNTAQQDLAIRVESIAFQDGTAIIHYSQPELHEVMKHFNLTGSTSEGGYFIPAEGVEMTDPTSPVITRSTATGSLPLWGAKNFKIIRGDNTFTGTIDIKSLEYRLSASPTWRFPFISIDEVYAALNTSVTVSVSRTLADNSDTRRILIGSMGAVPLGYGFFVSGPIYLDAFTGEVSIELSWGMDAKLGVQYTSSNWIRPVRDVDLQPLQLKLKGELKFGVDAQVNINFLGIVLLAEGAQVGLAASGEVVLASSNMSLGEEICVDIAAYLYFTLYTQIGPDGWCKRYEKEVFNKDNSILNWGKHLEETGFVEKCTRGSGDYMGTVTDAQTGEPIYHAKVTLYKWQPLLPEETTFTDSDGVFKGTSQNKGKYKLRITAGGYEPYECEVNIIGGNTTQIAPQMMLSRETTDAGLLSGALSGVVTDAMTGRALSGVQVSVYTCALPNVGQRVATATTNSNGMYSVTLNAGVYEVIYTKDKYIPNGTFVTIFGNKPNHNVSLNPENQSAEINNLRAVLHWGPRPQDLDSHLVGPGFHVFYYNKVAANANLDVDDVDGYGPETTTITRNRSGKYSFYVHDYTNRRSYSSSAMSASGAYVDLYNGNQHLYRIQIPTGKAGTVWHVFDYDGDTRYLTLVNSFSYQSDPRFVGSGTIVTRSLTELPPKAYELEQ